MKLILILYLIINPINDLDKIAKINKAKKEAEKAYLEENYALANEKYKYLRDSLGVEDDKLLLNLANTQYHLNDSTTARSTYNELTNSPSKTVSSLAHQQLGAMDFKNQKYKEALEHYKSALKRAPDNQDARYNYELLKKLVEEQEQQQDQNQDQQNQDQQNKDQENQDQNKDQENQDQQNKDQEQKDQEQQEQNKEEQNQEQQEQDQEQKDQQEQQEQDQQEQQSEEQKKKEEEQKQPNSIDEEKLKEMKISEEKARLILEAMKNNEIQYIQQNKRKAKKKKDPNKPDW